MSFCHEDRDEYMHKLCTLLEEHFKCHPRISVLALYKLSKKAFYEISVRKLEDDFELLKGRIEAINE